MTAAYPTAGEAGTYTPVLHDEFVSRATWWYQLTGPTDVWAGPGDAWNAGASSGGVSSHTDGYLRVEAASASAYAYCRSWPTVPANGATAMFEATTILNADLSSGRVYLGLVSSELPTSITPQTLWSQYVVLRSTGLYVKGPGGSQQWLRGSSGSQVPIDASTKTVRLYNGTVYAYDVNGAVLWSRAITTPGAVPTTDLRYHFGVHGFSGSANLYAARLGSYAETTPFKGWGIAL